VRDILIVGASSSLGHAVLPLAAKLADVRVVPTFNQRPVTAGVHFDFRQKNLPKELDSLNDKTTVLLLSAISDPSTVHRDPKYASEINVEGLSRFVEYCSKRGWRLIFSSSVEVFDGTGAPNPEDQVLNPLNDYGKMKAEAERQIQSLFPLGKYSIVRTPWISHMNTTSRCVIKNTYEMMLDKDLHSFAVDYLTGLISGLDAARAYSLLLNSPDLPSAIHFAADGHLSRSSLAHLILSASNRQGEMRYVETSFDKLELSEPRARDTRLNNSLSKQIFGFDYEPLQDLVVAKVRLLDGA